MGARRALQRPHVAAGSALAEVHVRRFDNLVWSVTHSPYFLLLKLAGPRPRARARAASPARSQLSSLTDGFSSAPQW